MEAEEHRKREPAPAVLHQQCAGVEEHHDQQLRECGPGAMPFEVPRQDCAMQQTAGEIAGGEDQQHDQPR